MTTSDTLRTAGCAEEVRLRTIVQRGTGIFYGDIKWVLAQLDSARLQLSHSNREKLLSDAIRENNALRNIVKGAHGALMDAGDVPMPGMDEDLYDPVMTIVTQRNRLRAQLADANLRHDNLVKMLEEEHARLAERDAVLTMCCDSIYALANYPEARKSLTEVANKLLANLPQSAKQDGK